MTHHPFHSDILVCQAGACRRVGSEAVLLEIEELAKGLTQCSVQPSGCLGACSQAPNAVIVKHRGETLCSRIQTVQESATVVQKATGRLPNVDDSDMLQRLTDARLVRIRSQARDESKWNVALAGFADQVLNASGSRSLQLHFEFSELLMNAGCWEQALEQLTQIQKRIPHNIQILMQRAQILSKLGQWEELAVVEKTASTFFCSPRDFRTQNEVTSFLAKCKSDGADQLASNGERRVDNYAVWYLANITKLSKHSAIYHFTSHDGLRGTPNRKGRGRTRWNKTWHTTLLAKVGTNSEGPLPWVERDYTPISSAKEWDQGRCDILIKIYNSGLATSWLYRQPLGRDIWLSHPSKTLDVPSLAPDLRDATFRPESYLLILAGSGIVTAPQVLHHTDQSTSFGPSPPITKPIRIVYACRQDDMLLASDLIKWCREDKLQHLTLVLTEPQNDTVAPFPDVENADLSILASLPNATVLISRISEQMLATELKLCKNPCRTVVSGPEAFNAAAKEMLLQSGLSLAAITILSA